MLSKMFKAYDVRAVYPDVLDEESAWKIGYATGVFLKKQADNPDAPVVDKPDTVVVSRDMRPHSPVLSKALIAGIRAARMNVIDVGMCDTSFIYFAINYLSAAGGVQTTASHNPIEYNGFKISGRQARPIGANTGLTEIQDIAEAFTETDGEGELGNVETQDLWNEYRDHVLQFYKPGSRRLKVVIDAANGMGGKLVPNVFGDVEGLDIIPLNFEITGEFVHPPNPLVPENMVPTQQGVAEHGCDIGVSFDGDADRCLFTDENGELVGCDHLTAMLTEHFLKQSPGSPIIYDLRSSKALQEAIKENGGRPYKSRVGHVFMKALLRETDGVFGGELSGHFYFKDNFYADSGAAVFAAVTSVLSHTDKTMSQLLAPYRKYPQSGEINFRVEDKDAVIEQLNSQFGEGAEVDDLDGVTIDAFEKSGWWFNVRPSNTEPLLRLNAEARDQATLDEVLAKLKAVLGEPAVGH